MSLTSNSKTTAILMAYNMLHPKYRPVVFDTETTGLSHDAQVVQIAVVDAVYGDVLLDTLVRPSCPVEEGARNVHGITDEMLVGAPTIIEALPMLRLAFDGKLALAYNFNYDRRLLKQSLDAGGLEWPWPDWFSQPIRNQCIMELYARYYGQWAPEWGNYAWQRLSNALSQCKLPSGKLHSALEDTKATLAVLKYIAVNRADA